MSISTLEISDRPLGRPQANLPGRGKPLATALCLLALLAGPVATAEQGEQADTTQQRVLEQAETDFLREIERARQLEAETAEREAEAQKALSEQEERERRARAEQAAAERRARQEKLRLEIDSEFEFRSEILERKERNDTATQRDLLGAHAASDSAAERPPTPAHMAPAIPEIRDLPRAIFSEKPVTIPAHTPGFENDKRLKLTRLMLDADGDNVPEVVRYVDRKTDAWIRQEEDRNYDGIMDTFFRFEAGELVERVLDINGDGQRDVEEFYAQGRMITRRLDRDRDGVVDAFYTFKGRYLSRERHDADNDGEIDLVIEYRQGRRIKAEEDTDRDGRVDTWTRYGLVDGFETVTHIEIDKQRRGFADTFESFESQDGKAVLARREEDLDGDGSIDLVSIYRAGKLVRREILKPEVVPL